MIDDLTMLANLPIVDVDATAQTTAKPVPGLPKAPEQPILPPDDPHRPDLDREPAGDPPPTEPPVTLPSENPGIGEPPPPRAMPAGRLP